jgi:predicted histone-like DNA-binding protein
MQENFHQDAAFAPSRRSRRTIKKEIYILNNKNNHSFKTEYIMKYKIVERSNPRKLDEKKKQYANPVNAGSLSLKEMAKDIAGRSSLTRGDIENVLSNFLDELPTYLKIGMSVKLGDFGTMRLSLKSEGVELDKKFDASHIKGVKIIFTPSSELKKNLEDIKFEESK